MLSLLRYGPKREGLPSMEKGVVDINYLCAFTENCASFKYLFPQNFKRYCTVNEGVAISRIFEIFTRATPGSFLLIHTKFSVVCVCVLFVPNIMGV